MRHLGTQKITTKRMVLRRFDMSDARDMFNNWCSDAQAPRFFTWRPHSCISETQAILRDWIEKYEDEKYYHWVITNKANDEAIGYIYLDNIDEFDKSADVHYLICPKYRNMGAATEALKAVIEFAFYEADFSLIGSYHHESNPASGRVMQKSGMLYVKKEYRSSSESALSGNYIYYEIKKR
ncbi:MAG: GNAT family N-acetyltransferase [Clostridiales bacterium]|nr:GNAT family N-acetyltransferase [Clostridiales bacterium]